MCSVNLIYKQDISRNDLYRSITSMVDVSKHRGPDSTECFIKDKIAFGFNRLEIVGGKLGMQPIVDKRHGLILICNGEIFNYQELKQKHFRKEEFITQSDVEVIMHLYRKHGDNCITYLEGQFSFLLFDERKRKILLGRDRFGINPLFYYLDDSTVIVASEIKSILATGLTENINLNKEGLIESLLFYGAIPPKTCFTNIYQVPPASYGVYNITENNLKIYRYWSISPKKKKILDENSAKRGLEDIITASVKKRLQGSLIPGVYLSGGLDSSIIGSIAKNLYGSKIKFFSISFEDKRYDESQYQKQVEEALNIDIHYVIVNYKEIIKFLKECIFHTETPLIRSAPAPMLLLSEAARKAGVKFVLCGEGADETFAGYPVFQKEQASFENKWKTIKPYLSLFIGGEVIQHAEKIYKSITPQTNYKDKLVESRKKEISTKLSQYLLADQGDRVSMANGVEQRFPFLDTEVVNFAFSLDRSLLIDETNGKLILREAFKGYLPQNILTRKKQGYLAPDDTVVAKLLSTKRYNYLLEKDYFNKVNIFDFEKVKLLVEKVIRGRNLEEFDANAILFVLTTHVLYDLFINKSSRTV